MNKQRSGIHPQAVGELDIEQRRHRTLQAATALVEDLIRVDLRHTSFPLVMDDGDYYIGVVPVRDLWPAEEDLDRVPVEAFSYAMEIVEHMIKLKAPAAGILVFVYGLEYAVRVEQQ